MRHIRATYSGGGGIVGNSFDQVFTLEPDDVAPEEGIAVPGFVNETTFSIGTVAFELPVAPVEKQLSNDGIHWASFPYSTTHDWSIIDPATGGTDADGPHTVYAKYLDRAGNWSDVISATTILDRGLPTVSDANQTPATGTALLSSGLPVKVAWSGADSTSGIDEYTLQRSVDGRRVHHGVDDRVQLAHGRPGWVGTPIGTACSPRTTRATTKPGRPARRSRLLPSSDRSSAVTYRGTWRTSSSSAYSGGTSHYATAAGAKATFKVTGKGFTWIASKSECARLGQGST